eukprot:462041-Ditylum_brightwellii.AAC.1
MARSLKTSLYFSVGYKMLLIINICQLASLCNGSTGIVKDILYENNVYLSHIPKFIIVVFGSQYNGPTFFPDDETRRGLVPVHPATATWYTPIKTP